MVVVARWEEQMRAAKCDCKKTSTKESQNFSKNSPPYGMRINTEIAFHISASFPGVDGHRADWKGSCSRPRRTAEQAVSQWLLRFALVFLRSFPRMQTLHWMLDNVASIVCDQVKMKKSVKINFLAFKLNERNASSRINYESRFKNLR